VCQDIVKEIRKYDTDPYKYFARFAGEHSVTGRKYDIDIGYERFLAPEIFFNPEIYSSDFLTPLPEVVDNVIQTSPIDVRRGLYKVRPVVPQRLLWEVALMDLSSPSHVEHCPFGRFYHVQGLWQTVAAGYQAYCRWQDRSFGASEWESYACTSRRWA
jgi:hypothetical protein